MLDEKTKELIRQHIEINLKSSQRVLDAIGRAEIIKLGKDTISKDEALKNWEKTTLLYKQLQDDFDAGNFETDAMILLRQLIESELPQKRIIRQNKRTNQLHLSILTPTEITDKKNSISRPIQLAGSPGCGIIYEGCTELGRQVRSDIVRFMDLWTGHYDKDKTPEYRVKITDMMSEWKLKPNSYSSFRKRLKTVAAAMTSIKAETKGGGYVVLFPAVFIEQNTGYFVIRAEDGLCRDLDAGSSALPIALEYWIDNINDNPYLPEILHKLTRQADLNRKKGKQRNVLHWKTLVRALRHFPQEKDIKEKQGRHYERLYEPLMREMDELRKRRLIDWKHIDADPQNWQELMQGKFEWTVL